MDVVKTIDMKEYRKSYLNYFILTCIIITGSFLAAKNDLYIRWGGSPSIVLKDFLLYGMLGIAVLYSIFLKNQREKLRAVADFEEKKKFHKRYFHIRMVWYIGSCLVSCILFLLVANWFFFYFALFELLMLLIVFPNKFFFKKELNDDDIVFI
jgi:hypothetical protein